MLTNKVRTYDVHRETPEQVIFILNRGRNAGKPLRQPCPNCFIYYCSSPQEIETVYWTFYALWKNGFFHPHLCGSVIEMLRFRILKPCFANGYSPALKKQPEIQKWLTKSNPHGNWSRRSRSSPKPFRNCGIR